MLKFFGAVATIPINAIIQGFTLKVLWGWFMVTTFALPALSIPQALGIGGIVSYMTYSIGQKHKDATDFSIVEIMLLGMIRSVIALALGFVYYCWL